MDIKKIISEKINNLPRGNNDSFADIIPDGLFNYTDKNNSEFFTAGFGKCEMTPRNLSEKKFFLAGFSENNPAKGILDPLYAHALWLDDNSGRGGHLFLSLDLIGLMAEDVKTIRNSLKTFTIHSGCQSVNIMCSDTHAGIDTIGLWGRLPHTGKNRSFMSSVISACINASLQAFSDKRKGKLYYGKTSVTDMIENIRSYDREYSLIRLHFVPDDGTSGFYVVNFPAHAETLSGNNNLISADFPCYMREKIKSETGAETFYTASTSGGCTVKIDNKEEIVSSNRLIEAARNTGYEIAKRALQVIDEKPVKPLINFISQEFYCPVDNPVFNSASNLGVINVKKYSVPYEMLKVIKTEISYYEIGHLKLLMVPGEIFPELISGGYLSETDSAESLPDEFNPLPLAVTAGDNDLIVLGLANDQLGYIIPPNDFMINPEAPYLKPASDRFYRKHYEETKSIGSKISILIAENFEKIITEVKSAKQ